MTTSTEVGLYNAAFLKPRFSRPRFQLLINRGLNIQSCITYLSLEANVKLLGAQTPVGRATVIPTSPITPVTPEARQPPLLECRTFFNKAMEAKRKDLLLCLIINKVALDRSQVGRMCDFFVPQTNWKFCLIRAFQCRENAEKGVERQVLNALQEALCKTTSTFPFPLLGVISKYVDKEEFIVESAIKSECEESEKADDKEEAKLADFHQFWERNNSKKK